MISSNFIIIILDVYFTLIIIIIDKINTNKNSFDPTGFEAVSVVSTWL